MGNPITDLRNWAATAWHGITSAFDTSVADLRDVVDLNSLVQQADRAFWELAQALQAATVLAATSNADTVEIGRDTAVNLRAAIAFLHWPYIPRYAVLAAQHGDAAALFRGMQAEEYARALVAAEATARALGDLRERLALDVAIAKEHADMVTRVAIEANARVLMVDAAVRDLTALIARTRADILALLGQDVAQLTQLIDQVRAFAQSIPGLEDLRAVNGYNPTLRARATGLQRLIDTLAAHDPFIAGVVRDLAGFLIDLAEIDDPLIRLAALFIIRQVLDHLALDTALRTLTNDLLGGILGTGPPKTLTEVTAAVGNRLNAAEQGVAALSPLADEADALHEMGTLAFDAALLGYLATGVTDPRAWADDTNTVLAAVTGPLLDPLLRLLGAP